MTPEEAAKLMNVLRELLGVPYWTHAQVLALAIARRLVTQEEGIALESIITKW